MYVCMYVSHLCECDKVSVEQQNLALPWVSLKVGFIYAIVM